MTIQELRELNPSELQAKLNELLKEQFLLKMQVSNGQSNKTHRLGEMRKQIARVHTLLSEQQRG